MRMYVFWNWDQKKMDKPNQKKENVFYNFDFVFQFYWDIINIQHCKSLKYTM